MPDAPRWRDVRDAPKRSGRAQVEIDRTSSRRTIPDGSRFRRIEVPEAGVQDLLERQQAIAAGVRSPDALVQVVRARTAAAAAATAFCRGRAPSGECPQRAA